MLVCVCMCVCPQCLLKIVLFPFAPTLHMTSLLDSEVTQLKTPGGHDKDDCDHEQQGSKGETPH